MSRPAEAVQEALGRLRVAVLRRACARRGFVLEAEEARALVAELGFDGALARGLALARVPRWLRPVYRWLVRPRRADVPPARAAGGAGPSSAARSR